MHLSDYYHYLQPLRVLVPVVSLLHPSTTYSSIVVEHFISLLSVNLSFSTVTLQFSVSVTIRTGVSSPASPSGNSLSALTSY